MIEAICHMASRLHVVFKGEKWQEKYIFDLRFLEIITNLVEKLSRN